MEESQSFVVPDEKHRRAAIGSFGDMRNTKKIFRAILPFFDPISEPKEGEWLDENLETGQTYTQYKKSLINMKSPENYTIYIQPCEKNMNTDLLDVLIKFVACYFPGMAVKSRPPFNIVEGNIEVRSHQKYGIQYNASHILKYLEKIIPKDAYCIIGVLMTDLYPNEDTSFVYGLASLQNRTGVFSLARYSEKILKSRIPRQIDWDEVIFKACKVMVHEIGHMFGLKHCIYYNCIMNGSNHMKESSNKPLEMCPVCLRKLYSNIKFNILTRYEKLLEFCKKNGAFFEEWISFYTRIIAALEPLRGKMIESIKELNKADYVPTNSIFQQPFYSSITAHGQLLGDGLQQYGIPIQYATPRITNLLQQAKNSPRDKK